MPGGKKVFIAEDDPDDRMILLKASQQAEITYDLAFFNDGQVLVDRLHEILLREDLVLPSLILLDVNMPRMNGFEVLEHLRENKKLCQIPAIVLTSSGEGEDKQRSYDLGAKLFLSKPVYLKSYVKLLESLHHFLGSSAIRLMTLILLLMPSSMPV